MQSEADTTIAQAGRSANTTENALSARNALLELQAVKWKKKFPPPLQSVHPLRAVHPAADRTVGDRLPSSRARAVLRYVSINEEEANAETAEAVLSASTIENEASVPLSKIVTVAISANTSGYGSSARTAAMGPSATMGVSVLAAGTAPATGVSRQPSKSLPPAPVPRAMTEPRML